MWIQASKGLGSSATNEEVPPAGQAIAISKALNKLDSASEKLRRRKATAWEAKSYQTKELKVRGELNYFM